MPQMPVQTHRAVQAVADKLSADMDMRGLQASFLFHRSSKSFGRCIMNMIVDPAVFAFLLLSGMVVAAVVTCRYEPHRRLSKSTMDLSITLNYMHIMMVLAVDDVTNAARRKQLHELEEINDLITTYGVPS